MEVILNYLLISLLIWIIVFFFVEVVIITQKKNNYQQFYNYLKDNFIKNIDLVVSAIEIIKKYASLDAQSLEKTLNYDESHFRDEDYELKINDVERLLTIISKIDLLSVAFENLNEDKEFIKIKKDLLNYKESVKDDIKNYNILVKSYNLKREMFPTIIVAFCLSLKECNFLELEENI